MNIFSRVALSAVVSMVLGSALAADAPPAPAKPVVSAASAKDLQAAQKALNDKKYDEALAALEKAKANPKKSDYDDYVISEFTFTAYAGQKNYDAAEAPLEAAMASKYMPPDELKQRLSQAAILNYQLKNYPKAIELGNRSVEAGNANDQLMMVLSESYYLSNDFKNTSAIASTAVDTEVKAGQTPSEDLLRLGLSGAAKLNDAAGEAHWLELMVSYHPSQEYWGELIDTLYHNKLTDKQTLQVYRLSTEVGVLKHGADYSEMAQLALDAGSPGEAVSTLNTAFAANAFTDAAEKTRNQQMLDSAKKKAAIDQPTLAKMEAEAGNAKTGDGLIGAGLGYFSYGEYPKAIADLSAGLAKGTAKDSSDARLLLGIAQLRTGDKDSAVKTFQSVQGDAVYQRLAALWMLRAKAPPPTT